MLRIVARSRLSRGADRACHGCVDARSREAKRFSAASRAHTATMLMSTLRRTSCGPWRTVHLPVARSRRFLVEAGVTQERHTALGSPGRFTPAKMLTCLRSKTFSKPQVSLAS
jgi:hypothetical protein